MSDTDAVFMNDMRKRYEARIAELEADLTEAKRCWDEAETERVQAESEVKRLRHQCRHEWVSFLVPMPQPSEFYCCRCGATKKNDVVTYPRGVTE